MGYYGNIGIGERLPVAKLQVKGQIMLSHNFNNVLVAKEKRMVGGKQEAVQFDLIGTYWGLDKKAVYIGAHTGSPRPGAQAERIVFGGTTNQKNGKAYIDLKDGKVYAKGFVTAPSAEEEEYDDDRLDQETDSLLETSEGTGAGKASLDIMEEREIDLGQHTRYLHRKVRQQADTIASLQKQLKTLKEEL